MLGWVADYVNRRRVRQAMARRALDVATTPAWTASWAGSSSPLNLDLEAGLSTAVARSRGLWRNNDYARRYRTLLLSNVLGPAGLPLQMRMSLRDGRPNDDVNSRIEQAWWSWGKRGTCDVTGTLRWRDVERLCLEALARDGEFLLRKVLRGGTLRLQVLDSTLLDAQHSRQVDPGRRIVMGVEIDAEGRPLAYWFRNRGRTEFDQAGLYDRVRVPAEEILHAFIAEEPGQVRGWPWTGTAARRLWLVSDFEQSAAVASSNAAKRVGFFVSPNGEAPPGVADTIVSTVLDMAKAQGKVLTSEEVEQLTAAATRYSTAVPGTFDTLPNGYDFRPFESEYPHTNHGEYIKTCIRGVAAGLGISYVSLGNDLEAVNYSSARVGILEEREVYKQVQEFLTASLHAPVFEAWLPLAMLSVPALRVLELARLDQYREAATWQPRRWAGIDPLKEAEADELNLRLGLTSRRRRILERGDDPDEIFAEVKAETELLGPLPGSAPAKTSEPETDEAQAARMRRHLQAVRSMSQ